MFNSLLGEGNELEEEYNVCIKNPDSKRVVATVSMPALHT